MNAIRRHPYFTAWIACCLILIAIVAGWSLRLRKNIRSEMAGVEMKTRLRSQLLKEVQPVDSEQEVLLTQQQPVSSSAMASEATAIPEKPLDGFIAIVGTVGKLRRLAAMEKVSLQPNEFFGFGSYAHQGPPQNELVAVHQQLGLVQLLVKKLLEAHPDALLAIRRERLQADGESGSGRSATDFFQMDRRLDLRVPGLIEGRAVLLEFTGQTRVLQTFLQSLAQASEPLVVRGVEVEPLLEQEKPQRSSSKISVVVFQAEAVGRSTKKKFEGRPETLTDNENNFALFDDPLAERKARGPSADALAQSASDIPSANRTELLAVKREPYRLQLVGYYGVKGSYTATFISPGSPQTLLAREGHRFESLGLVLREFSVKKFTTENSRGRAMFEMNSRALVWDERSQTQVTLTGGAPLMTEKLLAVVRLGPPFGPPRELSVGDTFQEGAVLCRIEHIQLDPAEVVIAREPPGQTAPEKRILKPIMPTPVALSSARRSQ